MSKNIVVWVDADEVLVDFKSMFHAHLNEKYKFNLAPNYHAADWNYGCLFKDVKDFGVAFDSLPSNWPLNLKAIPGAKQFITTLKELGCKVVVITHLPAEKAPDRLENFAKNELNFDEIYFTWGRDKCDYAKALLPRYGQAHHLFIDDRASNVTGFLDKMPGMLSYAVTLNVPYNKETFEKYSNIPQHLLDTASTSQSEMYAKIIAKVKRLKEGPGV